MMLVGASRIGGLSGRMVWLVSSQQQPYCQNLISMELWASTAKKRLMSIHVNKATVPDTIREWPHPQLTDPTGYVLVKIYVFIL